LFSQTPGAFSQATQPNPGKFRYERVILPGGKGPNRLLIDAEMLKGGNPNWQLAKQVAGSEREPIVLAAGGLNDLRIYDSLQREIPYLMIMPPLTESKWQEGRLAPMALTKRTSGSAIDLGGFRYARAISAGHSGLSSLPLDAAVLAHSRMDDLRIAKPDGRQVAYILEKVDAPLSLDLPKMEKINAPQSQSLAGQTGIATRTY
jgi:hypothetical protein